MTPGSLQDLYHQTILEHAVNPRGLDAALQATHQADRDNTVCGDRVEIRLEVGDSRIRQAAFSGESCAICTASASLLCEQIEDTAVEDFLQQSRRLLAALQAGSPSAHPDLDEALIPLTGVLGFPARINCARLPWLAARDALAGTAGS